MTHWTALPQTVIAGRGDLRPQRVRVGEVRYFGQIAAGGAGGPSDDPVRHAPGGVGQQAPAAQPLLQLRLLQAVEA